MYEKRSETWTFLCCWCFFFFILATLTIVTGTIQYSIFFRYLWSVTRFITAVKQHPDSAQKISWSQSDLNAIFCTFILSSSRKHVKHMNMVILTYICIHVRWVCLWDYRIRIHNSEIIFAVMISRRFDSKCD